VKASTPARRDDEEHSGDSERQSGNDCSSAGEPEERDLSGCEPDTGEQHEQERDLGETYSHVVSKSENRNHVQERPR